MKNTIYNKIRYTLLTAAGVCALSSCTDFLTITPADKTVLEDYWKTKDDVDQMVAGAYKYMIASDVIERAIIWGELRSDEVQKNTSTTNTTIDNIVAVNLLPSQGYNAWSAFYKVINTCNLVMEHAPAVVDLDPAFTEGDYETVKGQMLALRALCHFYLIRTFRDIPYVTKAYENTDDMEVEGQLPPSESLQMCLDDLLEAEKYCYKYGTFGEDDWRNVGLVSRDAVDAMLADVYLWRASMTHNASDYEQVLTYTQKVIDSHQSYFEKYGTGTTSSSNPYNLERGSQAQTIIFAEGNSSESVFELQFDGSANSNSSVRSYYSTEKETFLYPVLVGSRAVGIVQEGINPRKESNNTSNLFTTKNDYRFWASSYGVNDASGGSYQVRKFVDGADGVYSMMTQIPSKGAGYTWTGSWITSYGMNWIVYRITDIMLMRAEALTQLASDGESGGDNIYEAYKLVKAVNDRSIEIDNPQWKDETRTDLDTLDYASYPSKSTMELLCLQERGRELCYEGKRWFDLLRHSYRHMSGVDYTRTLYEIDPTGNNLPSLSETGNAIRAIMSLKTSSDGSSISYKMKNEGFLYWPIYESEIKKNDLLHQNPVYVETKTSQKN